MKIEGREVTDRDYLSPVTYVPGHVDGNANHPDCERGVIIHASGEYAKVLYCNSRTVQATHPDDLVWG